MKVPALTGGPLAMAGDFDRMLGLLETAVAPGLWLLGERFSAAGVMIGSELHFGIDRCLAGPAFQRANAIDSAAV
jgi:glutathione S-transferase